MLMHGLDDLGGRDRLGARETLQKRCEAEEMIAVSVGDIDRGEVLAARDDPIQQGLRLLDREKGVHENGVALTVDECRRIRHPRQFFLAGRQIATEARALYRKYIPMKISVSEHRLRHGLFSFNHRDAGETRRPLHRMKSETSRSIIVGVLRMPVRRTHVAPTPDRRKSSRPGPRTAES